MANCECYARIEKSDPRYEIWKQVTSDAIIPLKHPLPYRHEEYGLMLEGDPSQLTEEQHKIISELLSEKFGISKEEVLKSLKHGHLPIKFKNCSISICELHMRCII